MNLLGLARHGLNGFEQIAIIGVVITAFVSLLYAWWLRNTVLKKDKGTPEMQEVWNAIRIGADSYLNTQLRRILPVLPIFGLSRISEYTRLPRPTSGSEPNPSPLSWRGHAV